MKILDDHNVCGEFEIVSRFIDDGQNLEVYYLDDTNAWCSRSISCWGLQQGVYVYSRSSAFLKGLITTCELINIMKNKQPQKSPA